MNEKNMLFFLLLLCIQAYASESFQENVYHANVGGELLFFPASNSLKPESIIFIEEELQKRNVAGNIICYYVSPDKQEFKCYIEHLKNIFFIEKTNNHAISDGKKEIENEDILNICMTIKSFFITDPTTRLLKKEFNALLRFALCLAEKQLFNINLFHDPRFSKELFFEFLGTDSDDVRNQQIYDWVKNYHPKKNYNDYIVKNGRHRSNSITEQHKIYTLLFPEMNMTLSFLTDKDCEEKKSIAIKQIKRDQAWAPIKIKNDQSYFKYAISNLDKNINKSVYLSFEDCMQFLDPYEEIFFPDVLINQNDQVLQCALVDLIKVFVIKLIDSLSLDENDYVKDFKNHLINNYTKQVTQKILMCFFENPADYGTIDGKNLKAIVNLISNELKQYIWLNKKV